MRKITNHLSFWIILAIILAILFGILYPQQSIKTEFLGKVFIEMIKIFIPYIIFVTTCSGIINTGDLLKLGRIGLKALIYFEIFSTIGLVLGMVMALWLEPGHTINMTNMLISNVAPKPKTIITFFNFFNYHPLILIFLISLIWGTIINYIHIHKVSALKKLKKNFVGFLGLVILKLLYDQFIFFKNGGSFSKPEDYYNMVGLYLHIIILIGMFFYFMKKIDLVYTINFFSYKIFEYFKYVLYFAPIGAFGAIATIVGKFGVKTLLPLLELIGMVYFAMAIFVFFILGLRFTLYLK